VVDTLLKTKLYIPQVRPALVPRPRLIEQLNEGLYGKLTLISAPPGFGKTTLLSEWVNHLRFTIYDLGLEDTNENQIENLADARTGAKSKIQNPKVAWVSLDEHDSDPVRFWSYVIAAVDTVQSGIGSDAITLLHAPQAPPIETTLTTLINAITNIPCDFTLILDDYHLINHEAIHQAVAFLLDHLPPQMHLLIASRSEPPLPLTRLRVRHQLTELRDSDLRFTLTEAVTFLNQIMGLNLSPDDIIALEGRTEGWVAGLQLAALSMQGHKDTANFVRAFTGSHRYIIDYLAEEVLLRQPEHIQTFLLQTSILRRMNGPLCDAVNQFSIDDLRFTVDNAKSKIENRKSKIEAGQDILEYLEQANLFILPLDDERGWYRYHHLFADFLQEQLQQRVGEEGVVTLHRRASAWYAENGLTTEAVSHALAADDPEHAAELVEQVIITLLATGEVATVVDWLKALPQSLVHTRPRLALGQAWAMVIIGRWDRIEPWVQDAEQGLSALEDAGDQDEATMRGMWGEVAALRAMLAAETEGDVGKAIQLCQQALERLPEDNLAVRSIIMMTLGGGYEIAGELDKASQTLAEALLISQSIDAITINLTAANNLGRIQEEAGQLRQAADYYRQALQLVEQRAKKRGQPGQPLLIAARTYLGMAEVLRERNDLEAAQHYLTIGMQLSEPGRSLGDTVAIGHIILARLLQAQGDEVGAIDAIQQAAQAVTQQSPVFLWVGAIQARLWLAQGNLVAAAEWAQSCGLPLNENFKYIQYPGEYSTLVRLFLAQERFEEAIELLQRMYAAVEVSGRTGRLLEAVMLQALARQAQGDTEQALIPLTQALALGEAGGYVRLFVDEGPPMAQLLRLVRARGIAPSEAYVDKLLVAFQREQQVNENLKKQSAVSPSAANSSGSLLVESLSERELEVLRLVADGLSNRAIAEQLFITVGTAKTHTINIYRKLDVRSRTQAVARATELGLL